MSRLLEDKLVLVVEDEEKILSAVSSYLESLGCTVFQALTGEQALRIFMEEDISFVVLDLMLPGMSGEEVCMKIRQESRVPIIMVTAKIHEDSIIEGLAIGADDYIRKPYSLRELSARMESILRRSYDEVIPLYNKIRMSEGEIEIDLENHTVKRKGELVSLTPNEFKILSAMMKYPKKVFSREELIEIAMGDDYDGFDRGVDTHIKNLRKKIEENPKKPVYIQTVHGVGYKFGVES